MSEAIPAGFSMTDAFFIREQDECWICRARGPLTAEHKFKASDLKKSFGSDQMAKFSGDNWSNQRPLHMNSSKSKNAKFKKSICNDCNSNLTKPYDEAYDLFSEHLRSLMHAGVDPNEIVRRPPWSDPHSIASWNCRKYFGKLIGCHAAESNAPIPLRLSRTLLDQDACPSVHATIDCHEDWQQGLQYLRSNGDDFAHIAHHGLSVSFNKHTEMPEHYRSGLRIDYADVYFQYDFNELEVSDLVNNHTTFLEPLKLSSLGDA